MSLASSPAELEQFGMHAGSTHTLAESSSSATASPKASSSRSIQSQHSSTSARSTSTAAAGTTPTVARRSPASTRLRYRHWLKPLTPTPLDSDDENDDDNDHDNVDKLMPSKQQLQHGSPNQQSVAKHPGNHDKELVPTDRHAEQPFASTAAPTLAPSSMPVKSTPRPRFKRVELSSLDVIRPRIYTRLLYFYENNAQSHPHQGSAKDKGKQKQHSVEQPSKILTEDLHQQSSPTMTPASSPGRRSRQKSAVLHDQHHATQFMDPMLLQASLALVLSDFFPLAGRLVTQESHSHDSSCVGGNGMCKRPYIECNDQGVLFAVADCSFTLDQIRRGGFQDKALPRHLHPVGLYPATLRNPPLLAIQVTYTQDGSVILGIAADSMVMDGNAIVSFMEAWSKTTQGKDYSPFPLFDRSLLPRPKDSIANPTYRHHHVAHAPPPSIMFDNGLASADPEAATDGSSSETEDDEHGQDDPAESMDKEQMDANEGNEKACIPADDNVASHDGMQQHDTDQQEKEKKHKPDEQMKDKQLANPPSLQPAVDLDSKQQNSVALSSSAFEKYQIRLHQEMLDNDREDVLEATHELEGAQLRTLHFTPRQLDQIKKLASEQNIAAAACAADDKEINDKWVSTGDALVAYLWKLTTISRRMEPDCKLMCSMMMDVRNRLQPKIAQGYIGNALLSIMVQMPVHSLLTTPLSLPSRLIRDELLLQTSDQIESSMAWIEQQDDPQQIETTSGNAFGQDFNVWSFRKLDLYSADFGQGPPRKVRVGRGGFGGGEGMCVMMDSGPLPLFFGAGGGISRGGAGAPPSGVDVYLGLQGEHLEDFEKVHEEFMATLVPPGKGQKSGEASSAGPSTEDAEWDIV
ncbi:hypothetical protein BGW42_001824 [Actinomortierella wolfii]|nr:hypothetical protein BGW42_001824 [Actinomortierella wolfii]